MAKEQLYNQEFETQDMELRKRKPREPFNPSPDDEGSPENEPNDGNEDEMDSVNNY